MKNLKALRLSKKLSQQQLALRLDLSQQTIYKYENGITEPDIATLIKLAGYFNTSVDYLIGNTNNPQNQVFILKLNLQKLSFNIYAYTEICLIPYKIIGLFSDRNF